MTKEERLRREGMTLAYHIVENNGIEGLRQRLTRNEQTLCPCTVSDKALRDFERGVKISYYRLVMAVTLYAIDETMAATSEDMDKICNKVVDVLDSIYGGWLKSHKELEDFIQDEYGISISKYIDRMEQTLDEADSTLEKRKLFVDGNKPMV